VSPSYSVGVSSDAASLSVLQQLVYCKVQYHLMATSIWDVCVCYACTSGNARQTWTMHSDLARSV